MNLEKIIKQVMADLKKNLPTILTVGGGVGGVIATTIFAAKGSPKAKENIEKAKKEKGDSFRKIDYVKYGWKPMLPAVISGTATCACIIGGNHMNLKKISGLTAACEITESAYAAYRSKAEKLLGEKKTEELKEELAKDISEKPIPKDGEIERTGYGDTLFVDFYSGRYFYSSIDAIKNGVNEFNHDLIACNCYKSLNEMYDCLNLKRNGLGDTVGWNSDHLVKAIFPECDFSPNGRESAIVVMFVDEPSAFFRDR